MEYAPAACKASASSVGNAGEVFAFQGFVQMVRRRVGFVPGAAPLLLAVEPAIRVHDQQCARGIPSQFLDDYARENGGDEAFPERSPAFPKRTAKSGQDNQIHVLSFGFCKDLVSRLPGANVNEG